MRCAGSLVLAAVLSAACSRPSCCTQAPPPAATTRAGSAPEAEERNARPLDESEAKLLERVKLRRGSKNVDYVPPSEEELAEFATWTSKVASALEREQPPKLKAPNGFELDPHADGLWFLGEQSNHRRGAGLVILRSGAAEPWIVEAPHTYFDKGTLHIALTCFEVLKARALLLNTVRRTASEGDDLEVDERALVARSGRADSDLAHVENSFFLAAHDVLINARKLTALQLHGFRDERAPGVGVVLSASGTSVPLKPFVEALEETVAPAAVRRFPDEIALLGGMKNVQAERSRRAESWFLHVEMSRSFREQMLERVELRRRFAESFQRGLRASMQHSHDEVKLR